MLHFRFKATNNESEYEALLASLRLAHSLSVQKLNAFSDSQLVVKQVLGEYGAREQKMTDYLREVRKHLQSFQEFSIQGIVREQN